jgi:hypothetical protein
MTDTWNTPNELLKSGNKAVTKVNIPGLMLNMSELADLAWDWRGMFNGMAIGITGASAIVFVFFC